MQIGLPIAIEQLLLKETHRQQIAIDQGVGDQVMQLVLTKSKDWQYEREFRLIGSPSHPDGVPLKLDGNFLHLPPDALASVIIGCRAKFDAIKIAVEKCAPGLPTRRAERIPNHYELQIV